MKNWKQWSYRAFPFLFAVVGIVSAPLSYWCIYKLGSCYGTTVHHVYPYLIHPLYKFSIPALFITAIVFFLPQAIFKSWLKFSAWFLPLAFIFIALTPVSSTRLGIDFYPYYRINAAHDAGVAFVIFSLFFIAWKYWRGRQANKKNT